MDFIRRIIAALLCFFQLLFTGVSYGSNTAPAEEKEEITVVNDISGDTALAPSVLYSAKVRNKVSVGFTDADRTGTQMKNSTMSLYHRLAAPGALATLKNTKGDAYITDSFDAFYTDASGIHYASDSVTKGRVNTIRLGEYYYDTHIRDLDFTTKATQKRVFGVDKNFHLYGDKLYMQYSLLAEEATTALQSFGSEIKIKADTVAKLQIADKNGVHTDCSQIDGATVEYAAFDIKDVGVVGFIVPADGSCLGLTVTLKDGTYTLTTLANYKSGTGINKFDETGGYDLNRVTFGMRIWNDETHDFDGIVKAAQTERNPLQGITVEAGNANAVYLGYEALRGTYTLQMDGTSFNPAYERPDWQFAVPITVTCDDTDRNIMVRSNGRSGCLEAAAILDENNVLSALDVEVCKNFQGDGGEPFYSVKDYLYGDSFFPLSLKAGQALSFTLLNLYQNWGKFPLKQLSSIEFHVSYYHLSTGTTESNCIAPYFVFNKDGWTLPDFRCRSGNMWSTQPQFNSVGILRFMTYRTGLARNKDVYSELTNSTVHCPGLAYADVTDEYVSDCGSYTYSVRHREMPQTDENRTYYTLTVNFNRDITFDNFKKDVDLFNFRGRFVDFTKLGYLNENNEPTVTKISPAGSAVYPLGTDAPYFGLFDVTEETEKEIDNCFGCNFALLIKDSKVVIDGVENNIGLAVRKGKEDGQVKAALTLNTQKVSFKAGDSITVQMILLPWGVGTEEDDNTVLKVREDSILKPAALTANVGTVVEDDYIPTVSADNNQAEFTLTGGRNQIAIKVTDVTVKAVPILQKNEGGVWVNVPLASENGYDGYSVHYEDNGTYTYSFVTAQESPDSAVSFRFMFEG